MKNNIVLFFEYFLYKKRGVTLKSLKIVVLIILFLLTGCTAQQKKSPIQSMSLAERQALAIKIANEGWKYQPEKIVDTPRKQISKIYISDGKLHFKGTYKGSGNFIVKLSDSNQDLVSLIANESGDCFQAFLKSICSSPPL